MLKAGVKKAVTVTWKYAAGEESVAGFKKSFLAGGGEGGEMVAQEDEAGHILERLHLGVALQPLFAQKRADAGAGLRVIACALHDAGQAFGMAPGLFAPPGEIALFPLGVIRAW